MNRKELRAQLVAEMQRLDEYDLETGYRSNDRRHNWGHAQYNVMQKITNIGAEYCFPLRAYRSQRGEYYEGLSFAQVGDSKRSSYGVCSAASGGRHARHDGDGVCPRCGGVVDE